jgi:hypothetical protein
MVIHPASARRTLSNPLRQNPRVPSRSAPERLARRFNNAKNQRAALPINARNRLSPRFNGLTVQRFNEPSPLGLGRVDYSNTIRINAEEFSAVPAITPLAIRAIQKSPKFRLIPHNST